MADERLMRDLDCRLADRDQPRVRQRAEDLVHVLGLFGARRQLLDRDPAARVLGALAELRQAKEDVARQRLLFGRERSW